jgi:hypothetical protein
VGCQQSYHKHGLYDQEQTKQLDKGGRNGREYQQSTKIRRNGTPIPNQQGDPYLKDQHTILAQRQR